MRRGLFVMKKKKRNKSFNPQKFDVIIPDEATRIFEVLIAGVMLMFGIFAVMFVLDFGGVTKGFLYVFGIFAVIILLIILQAKTWKLTVRENKLSVNGIYRKKADFTFGQIDKIVVGKKSELKVYVSGKKVTTIDPMCVHYKEFIEVAKHYNCTVL